MPRVARVSINLLEPQEVFYIMCLALPNKYVFIQKIVEEPHFECVQLNRTHSKCELLLNFHLGPMHLKGGDRVDADGNPLLAGSFWQKALFFGLESVACPRLPSACLLHRNGKDAAFCC